MIVILKHGVNQEMRAPLIEWLKGQGLGVHISDGDYQTVLGLIGDTSHVDMDLIASLGMVDSVKRITDRTNYYKVSLCRLQAAGHTLALAVGKRETDVAVVGVTEPHLAAAVRELLTAEKQI